MTCEDCGTRMSDGMCPNCHEELFIATFQGDDMEQPWSDEFRDKVEEQAVIVKEMGRTRGGTKGDRS